MQTEWLILTHFHLTKSEHLCQKLRPPCLICITSVTVAKKKERRNLQTELLVQRLTVQQHDDHTHRLKRKISKIHQQLNVTSRRIWRFLSAVKKQQPAGGFRGWRCSCYVTKRFYRSLLPIFTLTRTPHPCPCNRHTTTLF